VLVDGKAGRLVPVDDAAALAAGLVEVLDNDMARSRYVDAGAEAVRRYDWSVVAREIMRVYETVAGAGAKVQVAGTAGWGYRPPGGQGESVGGTSPQAGGTPTRRRARGTTRGSK
jgi:phosphatidylinositol alpha-mannosyltransferase